ncbi:MAG: tetratricopeptide repeat protein [Anaerolineales bacterium]|nr:tetratricopeptide repeat protein [Anaerolineales bacterium]
MVTQCEQCGFNNPPGMRFCGNCGARLDQTAPVEAKQAAPAEAFVPALGVMMGADLAERLRQAGLEASGQRRNVTVLFADISGYTSLSERIDGEDLYDIVQRYISILSNNIYKFEGIVDKISGDGLMALFGAPISHENNAERAVRAALDMQNDLFQFSRELRERLGVDINVRIGLHSGAVIVGGIGSNLLMDYTAIGDTVNLAHRIEEAAPPGAILISEAVYHQVRAFFDCQQVSVLNPKGIAHPVTAYRVAGLKIMPGSARGIEDLRAPMIGRDQELIYLKQTVANLIDNRRGQFVIVTGEAGLGKSRLTAEFLASLDPGAVRFLQGQSLAYRRVSYWLIREIFFDYLGLPTSTPALQVRERLARYLYQLMDNQAGDALPYLEHLLSLPYSDPATADRLRHLDGGQLRQQIFLAVRDVFLLESCNRPLLIVLDDLHWADDASLELLSYLTELLHTAPIFFLAISRSITPGALEKIVSWAEENLGEDFHRITLQQLSLDQSKQLLVLLLSIPDLPEKLREQILRRAAGIPFYLEEILRMLIDEGILTNENGYWRVVPDADVAALGVPNTLQDLILARFDRLLSVQRKVLQTASVVGKDFSLPLLSAVLRTMGKQDLHAAIDALVERNFILPQSGTHDTEYTFRHILMSDAIYGTMLRKDRSKVHGQVAEVIETLYADRLDEQVELLANHYRWSLKLDKALHYLILAGQKAARNHVNEQAKQHFMVAMELLAQVRHSPYQSLQVHLGLGDVLIFAGEYPQARSHYQDALQIVHGRDADSYAEERSALYRKIARTYERQGDYDQALLHLSLAQDALDDSSRAQPVLRAEVWNDIAWIYFRRGNFGEAQELLIKALDLVERSDAYDVVASIYNRLGGVAYNQGDWERAAEYLRKSIAIRETTRDVVGLATSFNNLGLLEIEMGKYDGALEHLTRSYELKTRLGQAEGIAMALNNLGWLRIQRGELDEARQTLQEALDLARQIGYSSLRWQILKNFGELYLVARDWQNARQVLFDAMPALIELGANDQLIDAYRQLGEAALGEKDLLYAKSWSQKVEQLIEKLERDGKAIPNVQRGELCRFWGMLATQQGNWQAAQEYFEESETIFKLLRSNLYQGRTAYQLGALAEARGDRQEAQASYHRAFSMFQTIGAKLEMERADQAYRRQLVEPG